FADDGHTHENTSFGCETFRGHASQGFVGFFAGGTALGMSSLSKFNWGGVSSFNFGASRPMGPIFGTLIFTVARSVVRLRMAPPRPATQAFGPPRYATPNRAELVRVVCVCHVTPPSLVAKTTP